MLKNHDFGHFGSPSLFLLTEFDSSMSVVADGRKLLLDALFPC
jgi:hypothetical protein